MNITAERHYRFEERAGILTDGKRDLTPDESAAIYAQVDEELKQLIGYEAPASATTLEAA